MGSNAERLRARQVARRWALMVEAGDEVGLDLGRCGHLIPPESDHLSDRLLGELPRIPPPGFEEECTDDLSALERETRSRLAAFDSEEPVWCLPGVDYGCFEVSADWLSCPGNIGGFLELQGGFVLFGIVDTGLVMLDWTVDRLEGVYSVVSWPIGGVDAV